MEKADILEMTVRYLESIQSNRRGELMGLSVCSVLHGWLVALVDGTF